MEGYPDRESWMDAPIDLSEDFVQGQVPLLMQWDRRWGYNIYGDSMIGSKHTDVSSFCSGAVPLWISFRHLSDGPDSGGLLRADSALARP